MATSTGIINSLQGKFYAQDENGNVRVLKVGDEIKQGEKVYGDENNSAQSTLDILTTDLETLSLSGSNTLVFDTSTNSATLENEEVAFSPNSGWMQAENTTPTENGEVLADANNANLPEEAAAAGEEATSSTDTGVFSFSNRDGGTTDIAADLRDTSFPNADVDTTDDGDALPEYNVALGLTGLDVNEDEESSTFTLTLSNPTTEPATLVIDANGTSYTYTIPAGSTSYSFDIPTQDSDVYVDPDTLTVSVVSLTGGGYDNVDLTGATQTISISDTIDDATLTLNDVTVNEGGTATVGLSLSHDTKVDLVVTLDAKDENGDNIQVSIPAGTTAGTVITSPEFVINNGEDVYNDNSSFTVSVVSTTNDPSVDDNFENLVITDTATVTVDDTTTDATLTLNDVTVNEGGTATVGLSLSHDTKVDLVVTLDAKDENGDNIQVSIPAGTTAGTVITSPEFVINNGEDVYNDNSSFTVSVVSTTNDPSVDDNFENLVITDTATVTVDDTTTDATLTLNDVTVNEGGTATVGLSLSHDTKVDLVVTLDAKDENGDNIQVSIPAGTTAGTVITSPEFVINNGEDVYNDNSSFTVSVVSTTNDPSVDDNFENLVITDTATVTVDDTIDEVQVSLSATQSTSEDGGVITYTASLPTDVTAKNDITVTLNVGANGEPASATNPALTIVIEAGDSSNTTTATVNRDNDDGSGEDKFNETDSLSAAIVSATEANAGDAGSLEKLTFDDSAVETTILDDNDSTKLKLFAVVTDDQGNVTYEDANTISEQNDSGTANITATYVVLAVDATTNEILDSQFQPTSGTVTVNVTANDATQSTTSSNGDYDSSSDDLQANGTITATIGTEFTIDSKDDALADSGETFSLTIEDGSLSNETIYEDVIYDNSAVTTTITDSSNPDGTPPEEADNAFTLKLFALLEDGTLADANTIAEQNDAGDADIAATYIVKAVDANGDVLATQPTGTLTVNVATGSAGNDDFVNPTTLTATINESFDITSKDDALADSGEKFSLSLEDGSWTNDSDYEKVTYEGTVETTITDYDIELSATNVAVDEDGLTALNPNTQSNGDSVEDTAIATGTITVAGATNVVFANNQTTTLTSEGKEITLTVSADGQTITGTVEGDRIISGAARVGAGGNPRSRSMPDEEVFEAKLNDDGTYTFELKGVIDHPDTSSEDTVTLPLDIKATNAGNDETFTINVTIADDVPTVEPYETNTMRIISDDDTVSGLNGNSGGDGDSKEYNQGGENGHAVRTLQFNAGADGGTVAWDLSTTSVDSGATDASFSVDGNGALILTQIQDGSSVQIAKITLDEDSGKYIYTQTANLLHEDDGTNTENNAAFTLGFKVTDGDGDEANGKLALSIDDDTPTIELATNSLETQTLLEESFEVGANSWNIASGSWDVNGDSTTNVTGDHGAVWRFNNDAGVEIQSQNTISDADAIDGNNYAELDPHTSGTNTSMSTTVNLTSSDMYTLEFAYQPRLHGNYDSGDMQVTFGNKVLTINSDASGNLTITTNPSDGSIEYTTNQSTANGWTTFNVTFTGITGNEAELTFEGLGTAETYGALLDDIKLTSGSGQNEPILTVDETDLTTDAIADFSGMFSQTASAGADGQASLTSNYSLDVKAANSDSGLVDIATGEKVLLSEDANGNIVGKTETSGATVFTLSVDSNGKVTLNQLSAIEHSDATNPDDKATLSADDLVTLTKETTITDNDGDSATDTATINIGQNLIFKDDGAIAFNDNGGTITEDVDTQVTGNVMNNDTQGADTATVTLFDSQGQYGTLSISATGDYTYTLDNSKLDSLDGGQTAQETFNYTLTDKDGDTSTATLTINVKGADENTPPTADPVLTTSNLDTDDALLAGFKTSIGITDNTEVKDQIAFFKKIDIGGGLDGTDAENDASNPANLGGSDNETIEDNLVFDITSLPAYGDVYIEVGGTFTKLDASNLDDASTQLSTADNVYWSATHNQVANGGTNESALTIGGKYTSSEIESSWDNDDVTVIARDGDNQDVAIAYVTNDGIGVTGNTGGPSKQLGYDANAQKSESIIFDFDKPATDAQVAITHLIKGESGGEIGKFEAFLDGNSLGVFTFSNNPNSGADYTLTAESHGSHNAAGGNSGTLNIGDMVFDQLRFSAQEYANQNGQINDSSDYFIGGITYHEVSGVEFNYNVIDESNSSSDEVPVKIEVATDTLIPDANHTPTITVQDYTPNINGENIVYEEALTSSTDTKEEANSVFTINANDGVSSIKVENTQISVNELQESSTTPITITTQYGEVEINGYNSTTGEVNYTYAILENTTDHTVAGEKDSVLDSIALEVTDSDGDTATSSLNITVVDDTPTATTQTVTLSFEENSVPVTTNLLFTLDVSGSMSANSSFGQVITLDNGDKTTRFELAKQAILDAVDAYKQMGQVSVNLTLFNAGAQNIGWMTDSAVEQYLNKLTMPDDGYIRFEGEKIDNLKQYNTDYKDALDETRSIDFEGHDGNNVAYFLSDGNPNQNEDNVDSDNDQTIKDWTQFIEDNSISLNVLGIGNNVSTDYLDVVQVQDKNSEVVSDETQLSSTIISNIKGMITGTVDFGADNNGEIISIEIDGTTYDKPDNKDQMTVTTQKGGVLSVNFATGEYIFEASEANYTNISSETFKVNVVDEDGDPAQFDLVIEIKPSVAQSTPILQETYAYEGNGFNAFVNADNFNSANATVSVQEQGYGVSGKTNNNGNQDPSIENNETLLFSLKEGVTSASFEVNGETNAQFSGKWVAYADGTEGKKVVVDEGTFNEIQGSETLNISTNSEFKYIAFEGHDASNNNNANGGNNANSANDTSDDGAYFVKPTSIGEDNFYEVSTVDANTSIDGGTGYDKLTLMSNADIDFSSIGNVIKNIEEIDLSTDSGANELTNLSLDDVIEMTDANNDIKISGTADDKVGLSGNWSTNDSVDQDGYKEYINSDDDTVKVKIQSDITDITIS